MIKTFNRQLTVDYNNQEDKLSAVAEDVGQGSTGFMQRCQRGSMVSETLDHAADKPGRYAEHMTNSAELLTQTQGNIVLDTAGDQYD